MALPVPLSDIPTLGLLYKVRKITPGLEASDPAAYEPNATYNDKVSLIKQDITTLQIDCIVNAANNSLLGGGGVDGAIHRAAGPGLLSECEKLNGCKTGSAKITNGYELPVRKIIHAVGPIYWKTKPQRTHASLLGGCYRRSLELAVEHGLKSIAFSALSTGVYGYPSGEASEVALGTVREFFEEGKGDTLDRVVFCNFLQKDEDAYYRNTPKYFPPFVYGSTAAEPESTVQARSLAPNELDAKLPNAPALEPNDAEQPDAKKRKVDESDDDFVVVEKPSKSEM